MKESLRIRESFMDVDLNACIAGDKEAWDTFVDRWVGVIHAAVWRASLVDRETDLRRRWRLSETDRFRDFVDALTPEQRRRMSRRLSRFTRERDRHDRRLRQFDTNQDGMIDDQERKAAREHMRSRRPEHDRRQRVERRLHMEIKMRFDVD